MPIPVTLLSLVGDGFVMPENSLRGITATLAPIPQAADIDRDCNGNAINLSATQFRKYRVSLTCTDQESPRFGFGDTDSDSDDGIWPGDIVTVTLQPELGSSAPMTLECMVVEWQEQLDEYEHDNAWSLTLVQV